MVECNQVNINNPFKSYEICMCIKDDTQIIETLNELQILYWKYLDDYHSCDEKEYPFMRFIEFIQKVAEYNKIDWDYTQIKQYMRVFANYQKRLPTAGGVITNQKGEFLLVKVHGSNNYGFPKGKSESGEKISDTAIREIQEETGLDVWNLIHPDSPKIRIKQTVFYRITNCTETTFTGYNDREIIDIGWHSRESIQKFPKNYSKQVKTFERLVLRPDIEISYSS